jgi:hypothetical protein
MQQGLNRQFLKCYATELVESDESVNATWRRVRSQLTRTLKNNGGIGGIPGVKSWELNTLQQLIDKKLPELRRSAAPVHFEFKGIETMKKQQ